MVPVLGGHEPHKYQRRSESPLTSVVEDSATHKGYVHSDDIAFQIHQDRRQKESVQKRES